MARRRLSSICHILLVEASSNSFTNLLAAEDLARRLQRTMRVAR
jgi:hypothetical protein